MNRSLALAIAMALCTAVEAAEPAVAAPAGAIPAVPAKPAPKLTKPLDLRIRAVRFYMMPNEYRAAIDATDADKADIVVQGEREAPPLKSMQPIPGGIATPFWMLAHPLKAWRALLFPFFAAFSSLNFLAETIAISLMEKIPLSNIKKSIIKISILPGCKA